MHQFSDPSAEFDLKEHDYIGLSRASSSSSSSSSSSPSSCSTVNMKMNPPAEALPETDLQLGLDLGLGLSLWSKETKTLCPQSSSSSANGSASAPNVGMRRNHSEMAMSVPRFPGNSSRVDEKVLPKDQKHGEHQTVRAPSKPVFSKWLDPSLKHPENCGQLESSEIPIDRAIDDPPPPKDQIVGWPPVRCFRRQALVKPAEKLVKVNMDGITIGRKVDLNAYTSYQNLMEGLEDMFQPSYSGPSRVASGREHFLLPAPSDFVLTYEDKDGDWMLVGDVPWSMFVSNVRRLRITRASETSSSAPRRQM